MVDAEESCVFFKVLLDGYNEKLQIPNKFVRNIIGQVKWTEVNLKSSSGKIWSVEIQEDVYGFHFSGEGWRKFVQDHDLHFGYFLVFIYGGNMEFFVTPFDLSECRKWYQPIDNTMDNNKYVDIQDSKSSEKETPKVPTKHKLKQAVDKNLKLKKKPQFKMIMNRSYLCRNYMHIPVSFEGSHYLFDKPEVKLIDSSDGKSWKVGVHLNKENNRIYPRLSRGWSEFCHDRKLKQGDICSFELISKQSGTVEMIVTVGKNPIPQSHPKHDILMARKASKT